MSVVSAMFAGSSALKGMEKSLQVISNNLANANTLGFKASRSTFQDALNAAVGRTVANGTNQVGTGVAVASVAQSFEQGSFETTNNVLDMAVDGQGFFVLQNPGNDAAGLVYTRSGDFKIQVGDTSRKLVTNAGQEVQGFAIWDPTTETEIPFTSAQMGDVDFSQFETSNIMTQEVSFNVNLDSRAAALGGLNGAAFDDFNPTNSNTYHYATTSRFYDSTGEGHNTKLYFRKYESAGNPGGNTWAVMVEQIDPATGQPAVDATTGLPTEAARTPAMFLEFDSNGNMVQFTADDAAWSPTTDPTDAAADMTKLVSSTNPATVTVDIAFMTNTKGISPQTLTFNLGGGLGTSSTRQLASESATLASSQDGSPLGYLDDLKVDEEGKLYGVYTNGQTKPLYRLAMATFSNMGGLEQLSGNTFGETIESGTASISAPRIKQNGTVLSRTLEQSNVNMSDEFIRMIGTQRAFQANSRIVSVSDGMLEELISLKR